MRPRAQTGGTRGGVFVALEATVYRRFNKPALGPVGDSLDDFK